MEHRVESGFFDYPSFIPYITHAFSVIPEILYPDISTRVTCMVTEITVPITSHALHPDPSHKGISDLVIASCYIPCWTASSPLHRFKGMNVMDGGIKNNSCLRRHVIPSLETDDRSILIIKLPSDIELHRTLIPSNIGTWISNVISTRQSATDEVNDYAIKQGQRGIDEVANFARPSTGWSTI